MTRFIAPLVLGIILCAVFMGSFHCGGCTTGMLPRGSVWVICR